MEKKRETEEIYNYREMVKKIVINQNLHFHSTHTQGNIEAPVPRGIAAEMAAADTAARYILFHVSTRQLYTHKSVLAGTPQRHPLLLVTLSFFFFFFFSHASIVRSSKTLRLNSCD